MNIDVTALHPLEVKALYAFDGGNKLSEEALAVKAELTAENTRTAVQWLLGKELIKVGSEKKFNEISMGNLGEAYRESNVPELKLVSLLKDGNKGMNDLSPQFTCYDDKAALGKSIGNLKKKGVIQPLDGGMLSLVNENSESLQGFSTLIKLLDKTVEAGTIVMEDLHGEELDIAKEYASKRGKSKAVLCLAERTVREYELVSSEIISLLKDAGVTGDEIGCLTPEMIKSGSWKGKNFRRYALDLQPSPPKAGRVHPYRSFLDSTKQKFLSMGFEEMRGNLVENEFWNMDALFMPQFHSARDIHDVYYVQNPNHSKELEEPYASNVARVHENGGKTGSEGWGYSFDNEKARRLILRSQGTALSARKLADNPSIPGKYFSVARCFRYDKVDATHLADFYQIEGIVLGKDINFRTLLGLLQLLGREVAGVSEMRFEPAYFPFTEPSVELHARHPKLGWIELGGAGLFRPEVTGPLGIDVPVIAWGLGIDRMAMFALGLNDIRELFSRDLEFVRHLKNARS
jgi:phenylalanyl-tRNA synthetase alpha chain